MPEQVFGDVAPIEGRKRNKIEHGKRNVDICRVVEEIRQYHSKIAVSVNGKLRSTIKVAPDTDEETLKELAFKNLLLNLFKHVWSFAKSKVNKKRVPIVVS